VIFLREYATSKRVCGRDLSAWAHHREKALCACFFGAAFFAAQVFFFPTPATPFFTRGAAHNFTGRS